MLPYDHRILYFDYIPFMPICFFGSDASESSDESDTSQSVDTE